MPLGALPHYQEFRPSSYDHILLERKRLYIISKGVDDLQCTAKFYTDKCHTQKRLGQSPWGFPITRGLSPLESRRLAESNLLTGVS